MKLSNEALLEIMSIVQDGLLGVKDASVGLRELDLALDIVNNSLTLTDEYTSSHPRETVPVEDERPDEGNW